MRKERRKGAVFSAGFHVLLLLFAIIGLPSLLNPPPEEPQAISVDLLPISEMSNIKPSEMQPEPKKPEPKPEEKEQAKPSPPVKTAEAPPPPPLEKMSEKLAKKKDEKKPEKKPDDKKEDKKTKSKEDDLAAVLKAVRETAQKQKKSTNAEKSSEKSAKAVSDKFDASMPLSMTEQDAIRSQIAKCWSVPAGAKDAQDLLVVLHIELEHDGALIKVELANESKDRYSRDSFFRAAADSAIRAVRQCSPLKSLPPEKYQTWRAMDLTFDPRQMLF